MRVEIPPNTCLALWCSDWISYEEFRKTGNEYIPVVGYPYKCGDTMQTGIRLQRNSAGALVGFDFTISRPETHGSGNSAGKASFTVAENIGNAGYGDITAFVWIPHYQFINLNN